MATRMVLLNKRDYKRVTKELKGKEQALISTRRTIIDESDDTSEMILVGDTLMLCDSCSTASYAVTVVDCNRPPHDPAPAFIKCVPA